MRPRELLNDFVFFFSDRLLKFHCDPFGLDASPSALDLSVSGEYQMEEVPAEDTPTLKSVK